MSFEATRWAWSLKISPTQKLVLLNLADRANGDSLCYPSVPCICNDTGLSRATVQRACAQLEALSLIRRDFRIDAPTVYHLTYQTNPPHSEATPPHSEATPPHSEATPPHSEATPPHSEATPPHSEARNLKYNHHTTYQLTTTTTTTAPIEKIEPTAEKKSGGGRGGFGENEIVFWEGFTKGQQEAFLLILLPVVMVELKQQALDVLTANAQAKRIRNTPEELLSALVRRIQAGTFDPSPGFAIAQKRKNKRGYENQQEVAQLESEINGMIRINEQGLLDGQIASKRQKLAELKASRPV